MTVRSSIIRCAARRHRSIIQDVGWAVALLVLGAGLLAIGVPAFSEFPVVVPFGSDQLHWWHAAPLVFMCLATSVQTRYPLGVFYVITALFVLDMVLGLHVCTLMAWANTVYNAARNTSGALVRWLLLSFSVLVFVWILVVSGELSAALSGLLQVTITALIAIWWGSEVRGGDERAEAERVKSIAARRREEHERQEILRRQRADLAAQLHDTISSHLSTIALYTAGTLDLPPETERDRKVLTEIRHASLAALTDMRELIDVLRAFTADDDDAARRAESLSVAEMLRRLRSAGLNITVSTDDGLPLDTLVRYVDHGVYRILLPVLQEALTNALKHGDGKALLHCASDSGWLSCTVRNPLSAGAEIAGSEPPDGLSGGLGLGAMAAMVQEGGGFFAAGSVLVEGVRYWSIEIELPGRCASTLDSANTVNAGTVSDT